MSEKTTFAEISPSEFFYRNRDLAGFTNPARALYMACRELLENSFPYDEPILVRQDGRVRLAPIGEIVERSLGADPGVQVQDRYFKHIGNGLEVLTVDEDLKLRYRRVTAVFKHGSPEKLWRIELGAERALTTTSAHNVFVLSDDCEVQCKKTSELHQGDRIIVPTSRIPTNNLDELDLIVELMRLPEEMTEDLVVHGLARFYPEAPSRSQELLALASTSGSISWRELAWKAREKNLHGDPNELIQTLRKSGFLESVGRGNYQRRPSHKIPRHFSIKKDWLHYDYVPFNFFRSKPPPTFDANTLTISVRQGRSRLPSKLRITPELMRVLGYFASEGSISGHEKVSFSFGSHELDTLVADLVNCLRAALRLEPTITPQHETAVNVVVNDATLAFFLERVFGTGSRSGDKRIPWIAFNVGEGLALNYLTAYARGDGYVSKVKRNRRTILSTSSRDLFTDLKYLLTLLGMHFSACFVPGGERMIKGTKAHFAPSYAIYVRLGISPPSCSVPIKSFRKRLLGLTRKTNIYSPTVQKRWLQRNLDVDSLPEQLRDFVQSEIGSLPVKSVTEVPSTSRWVYDISVEGVERFIGGHGVALLHNSLDATELYGVLPELYVRLIPENPSGELADPKAYKLSVLDNGPGVEPSQVPSAFGKVFYGSKYVLRQSRGMFGLGGTMAILYGQVTTNKPVRIATSADGKKKYNFEMLIDIAENKPNVLKREAFDAGGKTGTRVDLTLEGDYLRASAKIMDYLRQTALVASYANLTYVDPQGQLTVFERATTSMPPAPKETLPHPHGIDVEALKRIIKLTETTTMLTFMKTHFHRVGEKIAEKFLEFAGISPRLSPKRLSNEQVVSMVNALQNFQEFLQPDASVLSPVGEEILKAGITKELQPEFSTFVARPPSSYSGFPFLVEVGVAYGGKVLQPGVKLFRFANRIPLLYDESSDVSFKVMNEEIDWRRYHVPQDAPLAVITHIASTKIPYKTVGKEYIADRPEVEKELRNATREALRRLSIYLSRKGSMEAVQRKMNIYGKFLPLIARFSAELAGVRKLPNYKKLLGRTKEVDSEGAEEVEAMLKPEQEAAEEKQDEQKTIEEYRGEEEEHS